MKYIFIDLEMNPIAKTYKEEKALYHREIMEIGAVELVSDDESDDTSEYKKYKFGREFRTYVKPAYNEGKVDPKCKRLTHITEEDLEDADDFTIAFTKFIEWVKEVSTVDGVREDYTICAWSESDLNQVVGEMELKKYEKSEEVQYMLNHWEDYQKKFCDTLKLSKPISLDKAVNALDFEFEGKQHTALCDAKNTAYLFILSKDEKEFLNRMQPIIDLMTPKGALTTTFGSFLAEAGFTS